MLFDNSITAIGACAGAWKMLLRMRAGYSIGDMDYCGVREFRKLTIGGIILCIYSNITFYPAVLLPDGTVHGIYT